MELIRENMTAFMIVSFILAVLFISIKLYALSNQEEKSDKQ